MPEASGLPAARRHSPTCRAAAVVTELAVMEATVGTEMDWLPLDGVFNVTEVPLTAVTSPASVLVPA